MSHFSVLVVTDEKPTDAILSRTLQPFHEFECTGVDDEFVKDVDITEACRVEFASGTERRYRDPDGVLHDPYQDCFYREWMDDELALASAGGQAPMGSGCCDGIAFHSKNWGDGKGYRSKVHFVPDGWTDERVPRAEVQSFREFVEDYHGLNAVLHGEQPNLSSGEAHKYGYALLDKAGAVVKVIDRTNPNKKWDWWEVGGRYSGRLRVRRGATFIRGRNNCDYLTADGAPVSDLDLDAMGTAAIASRQAVVEAVESRFGTGNLNDAIRAYRAANAAWRLLPEPRPRGREFGEWMEATQPEGTLARQYWDADPFGEIDVSDGQTVAEWVAAAPTLSAWAVLKDGQWFERGEMGWFGASHNEKPTWNDDFAKLFADLRPDQWVTVVDCHI